MHKWEYPISAKADSSTCEKCKAHLKVKSLPSEQEMFNVIGRIYGQLEPGNKSAIMFSKPIKCNFFLRQIYHYRLTP